MGDGYGYKCKRCGHKYNVLLGCGLRFPIEYRNTIKEIKRFKHGIRWRNLVKKHMCIDAERDLYQCECGYWKVKNNLSIYEPIDENIVTTSEKEYPLITRWKIEKENYRLVAEYNHRCRRCHKVMHVVKKEDVGELPCPICRKLNESDTFIRWD